MTVELVKVEEGVGGKNERRYGYTLIIYMFVSNLQMDKRWKEQAAENGYWVKDG